VGVSPPPQNLHCWVFHELSAFVSDLDLDGDLSYWRPASGIDVRMGEIRWAVYPR
jgi:hypothetical protein